MNQDELRVLEERIKANPKSRSFLQLAEAYIGSGRQDDALELLRKGEEFYPYYLASRITYGTLLQERGDIEGAIGQFEFVNRTIPDNLVALRSLSHLYMEKKNLGEARSAAKGILALSPNDPEMIELLQKITEMEMKEIPTVNPAAPLFTSPNAISAPETPVSPPILEETTEEPSMDDPDDLFSAIRGRIPEETLPSEPSFLSSAEEDVPVEEVAPLDPILAEPSPEPQPVHSGLTQTETMGDLLFDQGHIEEARSVYESVLKKDPENLSVAGKLQTIQRMLAADVPPKLQESEPDLSVKPRSEPHRETVWPEKEILPKPPAPSPAFWVPPREKSPEGPGDRSLPERIVQKVTSRMSRDVIGYVQSSRDGLPVESSDSGHWADVLAAGGIEIIRTVADMTGTLDWGEFKGTMVWLERAILYGIPVGDDQALFLVLSHEANIGLCRLLVEQCTIEDADGASR